MVKFLIRWRHLSISRKKRMLIVPDIIQHSAKEEKLSKKEIKVI